MTLERKSFNRYHSRRSNQRRRRGGYVLVLVALLLFGLMAMAALVIDIGFARLSQRQMQSATDAAALEGLRFRDSLPPMPQSQELGEARRIHASTVVSQLFDDNLPALEINRDNQADGDMVVGTFTPISSAMTAEQIREHHLEQQDYSRNDFSDDGAGAFLVRIRRTNETSSQGIRTSGPSLPYLFGRGSLIDRQLIGDGIKVRATGIATTLPAVAIGLPVSNLKAGAIPVAISNTRWRAMLANTDLPVQVDNVDCYWISGPNDVNGSWPHHAIGQALPGASPMPTNPFVFEGYVCVFETSLNVAVLTANRIIGFGFVRIKNDPLNPTNGIVINRIDPENRGSSVATGNATSRLSEAWQALSSLSDTELREVRRLNENLEFPLLAPVLVR